MLVLTNSLKPYPLNKELFESLPKNDYTALKEDIKKNGIKTELHITKSNTILCGHQRWNIARDLELKEVPVKIVKIDETDEQAVKEYVIIDNLLRRHLAIEQRAKLEYELYKTYEKVSGRRTDLSDNIPKVDLYQDISKKVGQDRSAIVKHIQYAKEIEKKPELKEKKFSQVIAQIRKDKHLHKIMEEVKELSAEDMGIYEGDCLEQLGKVKDNTVACLIIDPPYGIDFQSNFKLAKHDKILQDNKEALELLDKSLKKVQPKMLKNSHVYIFTHWKVFEFVKPIVEKYFDVKNVLIWNKNNWSMGDLEGNYAEKYEMIIFASQGNRKLLGDKRPVNVLDFERTNNSNHPTEKPVNLLKELIKNSTIYGELVLDYFAGSGSTMVASRELKRKAIAIEIKREFIDIIKSRNK